MTPFCLLLLLGQTMNAAEIHARRESLKLRTTDEIVACGQQESVWDRWNVQGPHEESPLEATHREALEQCLTRVRAHAAALASPESPRAASSEHEASDQPVADAPAVEAATTAPPSAGGDGDEWGGRRQMSSAYICGLRSARTGIEKSIAEEKRYAAQTGVVNLGRLEFLKHRLRGIDNGIAAQKQSLADINRKVLPCQRPRPPPYRSSRDKDIIWKLSRCIAIRAEVDGEIVQWDQIGSDAECADPDVVWMLETYLPKGE